MNNIGMLNKDNLYLLFDYYVISPTRYDVDTVYKYLMSKYSNNIRGYDIVNVVFELYGFYDVLKEIIEINNEMSSYDDDSIDFNDQIEKQESEEIQYDLIESHEQHIRRREVLLDTLSFLEELYIQKNNKKY